MMQHLKLMDDILKNGSRRETRSGTVLSVFNRSFSHNMRYGFPMVTTKKASWRLIMGELLWFLSGKTDLPSLRKYSCLPEGAKTIWTGDAERWGGKGNDDCGNLYGYTWRNFNGEGIDQIQNLIDVINNDPSSRYQTVTAWNPIEMNDRALALPACHQFFHTYVDGEYLDLHWTQRSVDTFLGLPYNIASYGALLCILAKLTGKKPRHLSATFLDTHIYENHLPAVREQMGNLPLTPPELQFPEFDNLDQLCSLTAVNFGLKDYKHHGVIKAPLSVG
jgi:thymidylate synthase